MGAHGYRRILLKLSGEVLMGDQAYGIDPDTVARVAEEVKAAQDTGLQLCLVIGGGNIFRGMSGAAKGMDRAQADYMGMLATVMNALALADAMDKQGLTARVMANRIWGLRSLYQEFQPTLNRCDGLTCHPFASNRELTHPPVGW